MDKSEMTGSGARQESGSTDDRPPPSPAHHTPGTSPTTSHSHQELSMETMSNSEDCDSSNDLGDWTWSGMWYEFTQTTTFHGIHYITATTPYILRRVLWLLIVTGATTCFIYIIQNRAEKYALREKKVNTDVIYNASLTFPAVTICNQNYIRMSQSYKMGTYNIISAYFSDNERHIKDSEGNCRHWYAGRIGEILNDETTYTRFLLFAELTLDTCRRLCSDLPQIFCQAFSFNKRSHHCYLSDVNEYLWCAGLVNLTVTPMPGVITLYKYPCHEDHLFDDNTTIRIGNGMVIPKVDKDLWEENIWTKNYTDFLAQTGHQKEDMIHSCEWQGSPCSVDHFETVMTDYGVCYSFNYFNPKRPSEPKITSKTGSSFGLNLVINVEEYDYMVGPHHDAGIKMFLHDHRELPLVRDLGFAVPPGRHALIDVRYSHVVNAKPPVGKCGQERLQYFSNYTWFRCSMECKAKMIVSRCGCIAPFMDSPTKKENTPICNMTHFFGCGIPAIDEADGDSNCRCTEPCERVIYTPTLSNAALSSLSIESILAVKRESLQNRYEEALGIKHRVSESKFLHSAESLISVQEKYDTFIKNVRLMTEKFESTLVQPVLNSINALIGIFSIDLNFGQFEGLEEALHTISLIYGPSRDTSYFLVDRVIQNSKLVSLHTQNLILYDFFYNDLERLAIETIESVQVAENTLPRYYDMVQNVSATMTAFQFSMDVFTFPPERLAKTDNSCMTDLDIFYGSLKDLEEDLQHIVQDLIYIKDSGKQPKLKRSLQLDIQELHLSVDKLSTVYLRVEENCLEQFGNAVKDVIKLNRTYQNEAKTHVDVDYTCDFDKQAEHAYKDYKTLQDAIHNFLTNATISKQNLQETLTSDLLNGMIDRKRDLILKIQFRLTERLRMHVDKARADVYDWYALLVKNADAIQEYMPYKFSEKRTRALNIWKAPIAVVHLGRSPSNQAFKYTYKVNTSDWSPPDFHLNKSLNTIEQIIDEYFVPINRAIDEFGNHLSKLEQTLTTEIKQLSNLLRTLCHEEKLIAAFVLQNFLQVDVYFSELRYQVVQQLEAYTVEDLMSDVGGYMGLLLGASVVTVFELLDVIIYGFFLKLNEKTQTIWRKNRHRKNSSQSQDQSDRRSIAYFSEMRASPSSQKKRNIDLVN